MFFGGKGGGGEVGDFFHFGYTILLLVIANDFATSQNLEIKKNHLFCKKRTFKKDSSMPCIP